MPEGELTVAVGAPHRARTRRAKTRAPEPSWPQTREEVDVALHSIGLALDALLDGTQLSDDAHSVDLQVESSDLHSQLRERFENASVDARGVDVIVDGERVILLGTVGDPLQRLIAEDIAWSLPQVVECENRLAVA